MSEVISVKGIVLNEEDIGDSDRMITVLTSEKGKISVFCKGARSLKSRKFASVQLFAYSDMTLSERNGMYYIGESELIESFFGIRSDIGRIALASYIAEAARSITVEDDDSSEILSLILNCLYLISNGMEDLLLIKAVFEMRACVILGFAPDLERCSNCLLDSESLYLDLIGGVSYCRDCLFGTEKKVEAEGSLMLLEKNVLYALRYIITSKPKRLFAFDHENTDLSALSEVTEAYFLSHVERGFSTLDFCRKCLDKS